MKACAYAPTHICIFIVQCLSCGQLFVTPQTAAHQVSMPFTISISTHTGFTGDTVVKNPPANTGNTRDPASSLWSGGYPEEGNGSPLQDFCLHNPMDRGGCQATVQRAAVSRTWLSNWAQAPEAKSTFRGKDVLPPGEKNMQSALCTYSFLVWRFHQPCITDTEEKQFPDKSEKQNLNFPYQQLFPSNYIVLGSCT